MAQRTCSCGRVWDVWYENIPFRDKDSLNCICGAELERWNGGCVYYGKLISEPDDDDQNDDEE